MSNQETSFVTIGQGFLENILSSFGFRCKKVYQRDRQAKQAFQARRGKKSGLIVALTRPPVLANTGRVRRKGMEEENRELTRPVSASLSKRVKALCPRSQHGLACCQTRTVLAYALDFPVLCGFWHS
ncbi:unnamed protein product [Lathyrus oleraceus]